MYWIVFMYSIVDRQYLEKFGQKEKMQYKINIFVHFPDTEISTCFWSVHYLKQL